MGRCMVHGYGQSMRRAVQRSRKQSDPYPEQVKHDEHLLVDVVAFKGVSRLLDLTCGTWDAISSHSLNTAKPDIQRHEEDELPIYSRIAAFQLRSQVLLMLTKPLVCSPWSQARHHPTFESSCDHQ